MTHTPNHGPIRHAPLFDPCAASRDADTGTPFESGGVLFERNGSYAPLLYVCHASRPWDWYFSTASLAFTTGSVRFG